MHPHVSRSMTLHSRFSFPPAFKESGVEHVEVVRLPITSSKDWLLIKGPVDVLVTCIGLLCFECCL